MKNIFKSFIMLAAAFVMAGCLNSIDDSGFEPKTPNISFSEENLKILLGFFQNASEKIKVCYNVEKRRKDEYYTGALFHERVFWHWWIYPPGRGVFILAAFDLCDFVDGRYGAVRRMAGKSLQGKTRKQQKQGADLDGLFN